MSQCPSTSTSSSNFRSIFVAAIKAYEKKTKTDLLTHPLATQLQSCDSPSDILAILQDKVNDLDKAKSRKKGYQFGSTRPLTFSTGSLRLWAEGLDL